MFYLAVAALGTAGLIVACTPSNIRLVQAAGCHKLVMGGSCVENAPPDRPLVESAAADPRTLYAACKRAAWHVAHALSAEAEVELAWARIFHLHGPAKIGDGFCPGWPASCARARRSN
ncbi:MAG TPA: NAD-dependent epimerase/dehydratase family protein [Polyangia bacterium]|nr:NAD-dependent epimerase/dehydratase family protein [Polyangia bacterium]